MRIFALYLPQFHKIKENDEWWGEGYTEWTAVKKSRPVIKGQIQPIKPMDDNYYDLTDYKVIQWQANMAHEYGVDGFVIYHYWYNGKKMLEKPLELLLEHPEIDIQYCMCWANHPWTRKWDGKNHLVLQEQEYGGEDEWKAHIDYLLNFFVDERYFKIDNKPVIFIYNAEDIPGYDKQMMLWEKTAKRKGFSGLFIVQFISSKNKKKVGKMVNAVFEDEPLYSARFELPLWKRVRRFLNKQIGKADVMSYDDIWNCIIRKKRQYEGTPIIRGTFCSFDNTPRRGNNQPTIILGSSPQKFGRYFKELLHTRRIDQEQSIVVINAWNEWGETAMLEPSQLYGFGYLEELRKSLL